MIPFTEIFFYSFATVVLFSALGVVTSSNPVKSSLFLVLTFVACSGVWLILKAEFLAAVLILVYIGAVMVLFLFVVMMLDVNILSLRERLIKYLPLGLLVGLVIFAEITWILLNNNLSDSVAGLTITAAESQGGNTHSIGKLLFTEYLYGFELAALILMVAMVLALVLTLGNFNQTPSKNLDVAKQVRVRSEDRLKMVKMQAENQTSSTSSSGAQNATSDGEQFDDKRL